MIKGCPLGMAGNHFKMKSEVTGTWLHASDLEPIYLGPTDSLPLYSHISFSIPTLIPMTQLPPRNSANTAL